MTRNAIRVAFLMVFGFASSAIGQSVGISGTVESHDRVSTSFNLANVNGSKTTIEVRYDSDTRGLKSLRAGTRVTVIYDSASKTAQFIAPTANFAVATVGKNIGRSRTRTRTKPTTLVVAIGIEDYVIVPQLEYTIDDATAFATAFREVGEVPSEDIMLLVDGDSNPVDSEQIHELVPERLQSAIKDDTVVFYFSGHGFVAPDGEMYLAPADFNVKQAAATGLAVSTVREWLASCPAKRKLVFLDACYSGGFAASERIDGQKLANALKAVKGTAVVTSSSGQQPSIESRRLKAGVFTHWLVRGLRGEANSKVDRHIDLAELFRFIETRVRLTAKEESGAEQTPTWAFDQIAEIPKVIDLKNPDKPSQLVAIAAFPLQPEPFVMETVLDSVSQFPQANPRRNIGIGKWVLKHAKPGSTLAKKAQTHIDEIDRLILDGKITLNPAEE